MDREIGDAPAGGPAPILSDKHHAAPSVFTPESLLREARRQRGLTLWTAPEVCVLDPDGDIVRHLSVTGRAWADRDWPCYHSDLHRFTLDGRAFGIVGCAVGAPFAVLVAEQLFACGCQLVVSITSSGQIAPLRAPPYFILIERALRDEGTSYHYLPPAEFAQADPDLIAAVAPAFAGLGEPVERGATWTTDALTARPPRRSSPRGGAASWRSRWRPRPSTPSRRPGESPCSASRT